MSLNGGAISWRSSRQGWFTLSTSEAEFVVASQRGQEVVYLRVLLRGFGYTQKKPTEIWEDNDSCLDHDERKPYESHFDVKVHYLGDLVRDGHVKLVRCAGT